MMHYGEWRCKMLPVQIERIVTQRDTHNTWLEGFSSCLTAMLLLLSFTATASALPPLTEGQHLRLETAHDGRDHREEAFYALVENVREWTGDIGDVPVRLQPNIEALLESPPAYRGDLFRLEGRIHQRTTLDTDAGPVTEWFVRMEDGRPIVVYVAEPGDAAAFRDGDQITIIARFYKRLRFTARDGEERDYVAFVGSHPQRIGIAAAPANDVGLVLIPLLILLVLFLVLMAWVRRGKAASRQHRPRPWTEEELAELDAAGPLPDDPAEALEELKRRAESR